MRTGVLRRWGRPETPPPERGGYPGRDVPSRTHDWFSHNPASVLRRTGQTEAADERSLPLASAVINVAPEGNLSRYLQEIRKFPMLSPEEELVALQALARPSRIWKRHTSLSHHICGSWRRSPWATAATACRSEN